MRVHFNIGSNLGEPEANLRAAVDALRRIASGNPNADFRVSRIVESEPWGFVSANRFCNLGVSFETDIPPLELLAITQLIEAEITLGHSRPLPTPNHSAINATDSPTLPSPYALIPGSLAAISRHRNADGSYRDRLVDIDMIFYGNLQIKSPQLTLPHPHFLNREFVLSPLREIDSDLLRQNS